MLKLLKNHTVLEDGAVFQQLRLVPESVMLIGGARIRLHNWKGIAKIRLIFTQQKLAADCTYVVVHNTYRGFYHWLLESIPKLLEAKRTLSNFTLLLPASYNDTFYSDTLHLLGINKIERLRPGIAYKVPQLALPYSEVSMGDYSRPMLHDLKTNLLRALPTPSRSQFGQRLYVSRKKAARRKIINEDALETVLTARGFRVVCFEDYSFTQQVQLTAAAKVFIGIHGAGLANIVFQPENAVVVELRKFDGGENRFYTTLAATLGLQYHLLYCAAQNPEQSVQDADLYVDIPALLAILDKI